jgi:hypothetical protein
MTAMGSAEKLALSFREMSDDTARHIKVVPPLLRPEVLAFGSGNPDCKIKSGDYILGYMLNAGFAHDVMHWHYDHPDIPLRFFWDKSEYGPVRKFDDTLSFYYLDDKEFLRQMSGCKAYASTAGFESICEAMFMGKPLLMVPSHIEQECNAFDATRSGAAISSKEFDLSMLLDFSIHGFRPDSEFPSWAVSAEGRIIDELQNVKIRKK